MSDTKTGGPAFPAHPDMPIGAAGEGMTLRDYFVAHAPHEPQPWFSPSVPMKPVPEKWISDDGQRTYSCWADAMAAEGDDGYFMSNQATIDAWITNVNKQRYVQWPAAWADEQLKIRSAS